MKRKIKFETPTVLRSVDLTYEGGILAGSIVDQVAITSVGQEVEDINASSEEFDWSNWQWEE